MQKSFNEINKSDFFLFLFILSFINISMKKNTNNNLTQPL